MVVGKESSKVQPDWPLGKQCRHSTSLNFSPRYIANLMPTLSYCKFVNNCSPNLLLFKVDRYEKLYFDPFFTCRAFWPCPTQLLIYIAQCPALLFAHALLYFCSAAFDLSLCHDLSCTVLPFPVPCPLLPCKLSNFWPKRP